MSDLLYVAEEFTCNCINDYCNVDAENANQVFLMVLC